jgi:predicted amidohydrolase
MTDLTIAIGSTCSLPGELDHNLDQISWMARLAGAADADLLLTPEMSASGYGGYPEALATAEVAGDGPVFEALAAMATASDVAIAAGFVERDGARRHLSHYLVRPGGAFVVQRKHRVTPREHPLDPSVELFFDDTEEIGHVTPGDEEFTVFELAGVRTAIVICADLGVRDLNRVLDDQRVRLMLLPVAAGGRRDDMVTTADLASDGELERYIETARSHVFPTDAVRDCLRYGRAFAAVNMSGFDGRNLYHGGSGSVVDPSGSVEALIVGSSNLDRQVPRFAVGTVRIAPMNGAPR